MLINLREGRETNCSPTVLRISERREEAEARTMYFPAGLHVQLRGTGEESEGRLTSKAVEEREFERVGQNGVRSKGERLLLHADCASLSGNRGRRVE
jgi:hypothetical protein